MLSLTSWATRARLAAYSRADFGSWMEQGPTMTSRRESSPSRMARIAWRWALTCWLSAVLRGNCCLSCNELGRRSVSASLAGLSVDSGKAETDEFIIRSEEHTSELQSLMRISYAVFCLKKKKIIQT